MALDPLAKYILYGILNTPLNCLWQEYLEQKFPGKTKPSVRKEKGTGDSQTNVQNLVWKFVLDQTVGAAGNILFFITVQGLLRGASASIIWQSILDDSVGIYFSGLVIWPLVSLISFAWVPVHRRVVFGCIAGVVWGVYLSMVAMDGAKDA